MPQSEDNPPTLASLRASRGKSRSARRSSSPQLPDESPFLAGLFASVPDPTPPSTAPESNPAQKPVISTEAAHDVRSAAEKPASPPRLSPDHSTHEALSVAKLPTERRIWTVRDLVLNIRQQVETTYTDLWVEGEISNCRPAPSGHIYFTLKDGESQLPVVLFRRQAQLLRFRPADGLAVLVRGRISIYETRGQLQLIAETMEPRGAGALQLAFEQLKARLLAEGLFDSSRKRPLPAFPRCIGIVTSPTGAVIRDIVTVVRRRHARLNLLVYPATMQGNSSPASVAAGIRWFNGLQPNQHPERPDLILIARGGGSMEDLACFNDETLARTIAASQLPIVSAIGHETDFTIADFVADLRAPTPSAAAEIITAAQHRIEERIATLTSRVHRAARFHLIHARQRYTRLSAESVLTRLRDAVNRRDQRLDELRLRLESAIQRRLRVPSQRLTLFEGRLRRQDVTVRIAATHRRLHAADQRLRATANNLLATRRTRLTQAITRLEALSPLAVLNRGYALVYDQQGGLLRSSAGVDQGDAIRLRLGEGTLHATVTGKE